MGHHITAILIPQAVAELGGAALRALDLYPPIALTPSLSMMHIDHYYSAYWQAVRKTEGAPLDFPDDYVLFPTEPVLAEIVASLTRATDQRFAIIATDYFGGAGSQWAAVYEGRARISQPNARINEALRMLGVVAKDGQDEFDTVGLGSHRHEPDDSLEKYRDLCDQLGV